VTGASASSLEEAARAKEAVRERIWALMERERVACDGALSTAWTCRVDRSA
jgi:hypothetical protein